jgi:cytidine deaminase
MPGVKPPAKPPVSPRSAETAALMQAAVAARLSAYAPYSRYAVGAAVLCEDGEIVTGSNIENASYGLSMCAERVALFTAHALGKRAGELLCVAGPPGQLTAPCGACRQVMFECNAEMTVAFSSPGGTEVVALHELLPHAFTLRDRAAPDGFR